MCDSSYLSPEFPAELDEDGTFGLPYIDLGEKWSSLNDDVGPDYSGLLPVVGDVLTRTTRTGEIAARWLVTYVEVNEGAWLMPLDLVFFGPARSRFNIIDSVDDSDAE